MCIPETHLTLGHESVHHQSPQDIQSLPDQSSGKHLDSCCEQKIAIHEQDTIKVPWVCNSPNTLRKTKFLPGQNSESI